MYNIPVYFTDKKKLKPSDPWGAYFYLTNDASQELKDEIVEKVCSDSFFPIAGFNRGKLINSIPKDSLLTMRVRDELYNNRINPILYDVGCGFVIFGNILHRSPYDKMDRINEYKILQHLENFVGDVVEECKTLRFKSFIKDFTYDELSGVLFIRISGLQPCYPLDIKVAKRKLKIKNYKEKQTILSE